MKAFISYSHANSAMLGVLHKHLAQLERERLITSWTDNAIPAGERLDKNISAALNISNIFIALLSPDYIASKYCYEKEFQAALKMEEEGRLTIVPVIVEPCDWQNTPFKEFKALPYDGKAISEFQNINTAFLDVIQGLRQLIAVGAMENVEVRLETKSLDQPSLRNYRVKKDFDSIHKMEFIETSFEQVINYIKSYIAEITRIENIKARMTTDSKTNLECLLVNRNKINAEARMAITTNNIESGSPFYGSPEMGIVYNINNNNAGRSGKVKSFTLAFDEYDLFWQQNGFYASSREQKRYTTKDIADIIWNEWLESVGIG